MATVLMPIPISDFDPTETAVVWRVLRQHNHNVVFATPDGAVGRADARMITGNGLGIFAASMVADRNGQSAYQEMATAEEFRHPIAYDDIAPEAFDGLVLPGGHAPGMRPYLESVRLRTAVAKFFELDRPVGAICHGVVVLARTPRSDGKSVLWGRKTTALTKTLELGGWLLTYFSLGNYFRTYRTTVEDEVRAALASPADFIRGPLSVRRDSPTNLRLGFTVRDGNYLSARWPGDVHRFAHDFAAILTAAKTESGP
jgi:protease I